MPWFNYGKRKQRTRVTMHVENVGEGWKLVILGWRTGDLKPSISLVADEPAEIDEFFFKCNKVHAEWLTHYHKV